MGAAIRTQDVYSALIPWLGSLFLDYCNLAEDAANLLRGYAPYKEDLAGLAKRMESKLLMTVHKVTEGSMTVRLDSGEIRRILSDEFEDMADDVLGVLMQSLSPYSVNYELLKVYSLQNASLGALRALCTRYRDFEAEDEIETMERLVRSIYPKERWQSWLAEE